MKFAAIFSGGKDSTYALYQAVKEGHEIKYLLTFIPERHDSYMLHRPCIEYTKLQAQALGIEQIMAKVSGEKEKEVEEMEKVIASIASKIDGIVSGALASNYQKQRIDAIAKKYGLFSYAPLWHIEPEKHWQNLLENSFKVMITAVASAGLGKEFLGQIVTPEVLAKLKSIASKQGMHLGFEGGEAETFVLDMPLFKQAIVVEDYEIHWDNATQSGYIEIKKAKLVEKANQ